MTDYSNFCPKLYYFETVCNENGSQVLPDIAQRNSNCSINMYCEHIAKCSFFGFGTRFCLNGNRNIISQQTHTKRHTVCKALNILYAKSHRLNDFFPFHVSKVQYGTNAPMCFHYIIIISLQNNVIQIFSVMAQVSFLSSKKFEFFVSMVLIS